ncbi:MAG: TraB/GumN family protein [Saprospiraceae bacterium]
MNNFQLIFCLLFFAQQLNGKTETNPDPLKPETVLFQITKSNSQFTSYLFGTHHAFGNSFFDSLKNAMPALISSEVLIKENLDIPGHLAEDIINRRSSKTKWAKYLNKEDLVFTENLFASSKLDFNKMTPTELHVFLSRYYKERVCHAKNSTDEYYSLDDYIGSVAQKNNLKLIGLETTEEQIYLINKDVRGMPKKVHKKRIARLIARIQSQSMDNCSEIDWYRKMEFDYNLEKPCQNKLMLTDRNNKWMLQLKNHLASNNCFIAVGLSHLMFECGLINQLKDLGYSITPIKIK